MLNRENVGSMSSGLIGRDKFRFFCKFRTLNQPTGVEIENQYSSTTLF